MDDVILFDVYVEGKYLGTVPNENKYKFIELFGYDLESFDITKIEFKVSKRTLENFNCINRNRIKRNEIKLDNT